MKVAIVTSEAVPFSKTGGLADVTGTLFKEYSKMGVEAYLFVPLYKKTAEQFSKAIQYSGLSIEIPLTKAVRVCKVFTITGQKTTGKGKVFFISSDEYFGRDELYGTSYSDYPDNDQRFAFFCKAVLELSKRLEITFNVIHCNDWQTGLIPLYLKTIYKDADVFRLTRSVLTIHNLGYQGIFPPQAMEVAGLGWDLFHMEGVEFYGNMNFLKAGIIGADIITTVSRTYAKEILTPDFGFGLDGILRKRAGSLVGIQNGIDYKEWNASKDKFLPYLYNKRRLSGKSECKSSLMKSCLLKGDAKTPLLCFIGRLSDQKGIDILTDALPQIIEMGANIIIIGKGEEYYLSLLNSVKNRFAGRFFFYEGFDEVLAHLIYAGSDIFLMPSKYEPCGLGQMIAMRYGTIPVARKTGGLADTIEDNVTGFLFDEYSEASFISGIKRAVRSYKDKKLWTALIQNAMSMDFSWKRSAMRYLEIYGAN